MKKEIAATPPVPPRRKKRKSKTVPRVESTLEPVSKPERKPRLPPPPPPSQTPGGRDPPPTSDYRSHSITSEKSTSNGTESNFQARPGRIGENFETVETPSPEVFDDAIPPASSETTQENHMKPSLETLDTATPRNWGHDMGFAVSGSRSAVNKYPPLFFTLQDFQEVMADSMPKEESNGSHLRNEVEPSRDRSLIAFLEQSLDCEDEDVCFRVTTTNVPFEKCLNSWNVSFESCEFPGEIEANRYIFEDYIDRGKRLPRKQPPSTLFSDEVFDSNDAESISTSHSATRVRFVIESPSSSTPDETDWENRISDSLQNVESIRTDGGDDAQAYYEPPKLVEIFHSSLHEEKKNSCESSMVQRTDDFHDVPFDKPTELEDEKKYLGDQIVESELSPSKNDLKNRKRSRDNDATLVSFKHIDETIVEACVVATPVILTNDDEIDTSASNPSFENVGVLYTGNVGLLTGLNTINLMKCENSTRQDESQVNQTGILEYVTSKDVSIDDNNSRKEKDIDYSIVHKIPTPKLFKDEPQENEPPCLVKPVEHKNPEVKKRTIFISESLRDFINTDDTESFESAADESEMDDNINSVPPLMNPRIVQRRARQPGTSVWGDEEKHPGEISEEKGAPEPTSENAKAKKRIPADFKEAEESHEKRPTPFPLELPKDVEEGPKKMTETLENGVPVNVRRNFFLENMLEDESLDDPWVSSASCEVIAAHPKPATRARSGVPWEGGGAKEKIEAPGPRPADPVPTPEATKKVSPKKSDEAGLSAEPVGVGPKPNADGLASGRKKSAGEAKSDVLNELLCKFSAIRLRPVPEGREDGSGCAPPGRKDRDVDSNLEEAVVNHSQSEAPIVSMWRPGGVGTSEDSEITLEDEGRQENAGIGDLQGASCGRFSKMAAAAPPAGTIDGRQQCAIARGTPVIRCNNNDNNAATPVAVSSDQSRADVSIAPGSVRSFVEYYETSSYSKSIGSNPVARDPLERTGRTRPVGPFAPERDKSARQVHLPGDAGPMDQVPPDTSARRIDNDISYTVVARHLVHLGTDPFVSLLENRSLTGCKTSSAPRRSDSKKSVQFRSGCTVMGRSTPEVDQEASPEGGTKPRAKRRAPERPSGDNTDPEGGKDETLLLLRVPPPRIKVEHCPDPPMEEKIDQTGETSAAKENHSISGIARSLPPSSVSYVDQRVVFYCTV
ncbi:uncharacterized protein LOC105697485 [Orussus abietinus]|uniref:uncharacterized protein LOC105697485 n=1 Tax=Orussus abietinus TaxID=222816 RepID=UPI0006263832|nr:uncharacterized protein LOC105697485 [Orussus abietinus]